jgi:hypothetical protein
MKSAALLTLGLLAICCPAMARSSSSHHHHHAARTIHHIHVARHTSPTRRDNVAHRVTAEHQSHSGVTCEMVRAYVAQVGLAQAAAMAQSAGITAAEKDRARRCLAEKS